MYTRSDGNFDAGINKRSKHRGIDRDALVLADTVRVLATVPLTHTFFELRGLTAEFDPAEASLNGRFCQSNRFCRRLNREHKLLAAGESRFPFASTMPYVRLGKYRPICTVCSRSAAQAVAHHDRNSQSQGRRIF